MGKRIFKADNQTKWDSKISGVSLDQIASAGWVSPLFLSIAQFLLFTFSNRRIGVCVSRSWVIVTTVCPVYQFPMINTRLTV